MISRSPIKRCFILLCYAAAALLATGAWHGYLTVVNGPDDDMFYPSGALGLAFAIEHIPTALTGRDQQIVIDLSDRTLVLLRGKTPALTYSVAIGQDEWQTPAGSFIVRDMRQDPVWQHPITKEPVGPGPDNPLGSRWIGFWTDGTHYIGLHGTNQEDLIGAAVSHGCVRMRNSDIQALYSQIGLGTPIQVQP